jgi:predicted nucleic acid-binding protein
MEVYDTIIPKEVSIEVIGGAKEQNIEVVIIDEKSARKFAKDLR